MKRIYLSFLLCCGIVLSGMAQEINSEKKYFPQAGDFAIGMDVVPALSLIFGGDGSFNGIDNTVHGKYFLNDNQALRVKLNLNFGQNQYKQTVSNDFELVANPNNPLATTVDMQKINTNDINLSIGYEWRRGKGRVQGFYGCDLLLAYAGGKYTYEYGNPITTANQHPSTANFGRNVKEGYRMIENKRGNTFGLGAGGFIGAEYFIAPNFSVGGEFGLYFIYNNTGQQEIKTEGYQDGAVKEYKYRERNSLNNALSTGLYTTTSSATSIFLMFYF